MWGEGWLGSEKGMKNIGFGELGSKKTNQVVRTPFEWPEEAGNLPLSSERRSNSKHRSEWFVAEVEYLSSTFEHRPNAWEGLSERRSNFEPKTLRVLQLGFGYWDKRPNAIQTAYSVLHNFIIYLMGIHF